MLTIPLLVPLAGYAVPQEQPTVVLVGACPHAFRLVPLGGLARWSRSLGYTVPILARDQAFDARWSVEAEDREFAEALVREREARAAIVRLGELGCHALAHDRRRLSATLPESASREALEPAIREQLVALDAVIQRLCRGRAYPRHAPRLSVGLTAVLLVLALVVGVAALAWGSDDLLRGELGPLVLKSLVASLPLLAGLIAILMRLLAGRSTSHKDLLFVALLALGAVPALGVGAAAVLNRTLDPGPATEHLLPVLEVRERRGESKRHYAVVPRWDEAGSTREIKLGKSLAAQTVAKQSRLRLTTSPGALGAERLLDLQLDAGG